MVITKKYVTECEWVAVEGAQLVEVGFGIFRVLGGLVKPPHSYQAQFKEVLDGFEEFHDLGLKYILPSHAKKI